MNRFLKPISVFLRFRLLKPPPFLNIFLFAPHEVVVKLYKIKLPPADFEFPFFFSPIRFLVALSDVTEKSYSKRKFKYRSINDVVNDRVNVKRYKKKLIFPFSKEMT